MIAARRTNCRLPDSHLDHASSGSCVTPPTALGPVLVMTTHMTNEAAPTHRDRLIEIHPERAHQWRDLSLGTAGIDRLRHLRTHDEATLAQLEMLAVELAERLDTAPVAEALQGFVADAEDHRDALDRLAVIHTIEVVEGRSRPKGQRTGLLPITWPGWVDPEDPHRVKRILTDLELGLVRLCALERSAQHAATIALGECGALAGELPHIVASLVETNTHTVLLPGGVDGLDPRQAVLPSWGADVVLHRATVYAGTDQPLLYGGRSTELAKIQSSISMNAKKVFRLAGLGGDTSVSFGSLRHTAARKVLDVSGTDAAVEFLGESNYEAVRTKLAMRKAAPQRRRNLPEAA